MAAKLTRLTHKMAIQLHVVAESYTICSSRSRWSIRKLLDTLSYVTSVPWRDVMTSYRSSLEIWNCLECYLFVIQNYMYSIMWTPVVVLPPGRESVSFILYSVTQTGYPFP
jgi:hypothetical protein